jgi:hypothetical protein
VAHVLGVRLRAVCSFRDMNVGTAPQKVVNARGFQPPSYHSHHLVIPMMNDNRPRSHVCAYCGQLVSADEMTRVACWASWLPILDAVRVHVLIPFSGPLAKRPKIVEVDEGAQLYLPPPTCADCWNVGEEAAFPERYDEYE